MSESNQQSAPATPPPSDQKTTHVDAAANDFAKATLENGTKHTLTSPAKHDGDTLKRVKVRAEVDDVPEDVATEEESRMAVDK